MSIDLPTTPMMQQYRELKARDPEALLLFRMGDFYEMFGDDAERASELLGLAVATRDRDKGPNATKMAGFPHPALEAYLKKLVQLGVRAAVCEQVEDPRFAKGVVKRDIVRVVTPGTLTEDAFLDPRVANYLAAVVEVRGKLGLAWVELSTGRFSLTSVSRTELVDEMARLNPPEVLVSETALDAPWVRTLRLDPRRVVTPRPSWDFVLEQSLKADPFGSTYHQGLHKTTVGEFLQQHEEILLGAFDATQLIREPVLEAEDGTALTPDFILERADGSHVIGDLALPLLETAKDGKKRRRSFRTPVLDSAAELARYAEYFGTADNRAAVKSKYDVDVRFRLHRFAAHLIEHTVQCEKALAALGWRPTEGRQIVRRLTASLGELEGLGGAADAGAVERSVVERAASTAAVS